MRLVGDGRPTAFSRAAINAAAVDKVESLVAEAREGAKVIHGGMRHKLGGTFFGRPCSERHDGLAIAK